MAATNAEVAILGASGYTGAELIRLLAHHPMVRIREMTADRQAGRPVSEVYPHLAPLALPIMKRIEDARWDEVDVVFCCLPHGTTQEVIAGLPAHLKIVDLSADFRLKDPAVYAEWYGHEHRAVALQDGAVYGLTEHYREEIGAARLVANPGCYPTTAELPLIPLLERRLIEPDGIVIDAKSGVTGAGRSLRQDLLFPEVHDGIHPYGVGRHRHTPEIEQELTRAAGRPVQVTFTPHLVPMNRGILATIYVDLAAGTSASDLRAALAERYGAEPFVHVLPEGEVPATRQVRGSNHCFVGIVGGRVSGRAVIVSATDNLVKGAAGQAIQNMNVQHGWQEMLGLTLEPLFP